MDTLMYFALAFSFLQVMVLFSPVFVHLTNGWSARRREILGSFPEDVLKRYFATFFPLLTTGKGKQTLEEAFREHYTNCYGRGRYLVPGLLLGCVSLLTGLVVTNTVLVALGESAVWGIPTIPTVALSALAGGYMWVVYDFLSRVRRRDLAPNDLLWGCFRLLICIPVGYACAHIFQEPAGYAVALMTGAFPTNRLIVLLRSFLESKQQAGNPNKDSTMAVEVLQGIGRSEAERFEEQGISTVLHLAYADPVELTIGTGYSFSYVVDCCSQALAWLSFAQDMKTLRKYGLPGAQEIRRLVLELDKETEEPPQVMTHNKAMAEKLLAEIATELKMDPLAVERKFRDLAWNPNTVLLDEIWQPDWNRSVPV